MNTNTFKHVYLIVFLFLILHCGPDAPHDNPLDPLNPSAQFNIRGQVFTYYPPFVGIPEVSLILLPENRLTNSNANGEFLFTGLKRGNYQLVATAKGLLEDTLALTLKADTLVTFHLDALPVFDTLKVTSHRVGRFFPPEDLLFLEFKATVNDPDGANDISTLLLQIPALQVTDTIAPVQILNTRQVSGTINRQATDFNISSIEALIGKPIYFIARDQPGGTTQSAPQFLFRVIPRIPTVISPAGLVSIPLDSTRILFQWEPVQLEFPFTFEIEIYRLDLGVGTLVSRVTDIPETTTELYLTNPGTVGNYFWVLYIVDEFQNTSRSREGAFRIINNTGG